MRSACGKNPYRILEEGEIIVGSKSTQASKATNRDDTRRDAGTFLGMPVTSGEASGTETQTSSTTESVKEWQIQYECVIEPLTSIKKK